MGAGCPYFREQAAWLTVMHARNQIVKQVEKGDWRRTTRQERGQAGTEETYGGIQLVTERGTVTEEAANGTFCVWSTEVEYMKHARLVAPSRLPTNKLMQMRLSLEPKNHHYHQYAAPPLVHQSPRSKVRPRRGSTKHLSNEVATRMLVALNVPALDGPRH